MPRVDHRLPHDAEIVGGVDDHRRLLRPLDPPAIAPGLHYRRLDDGRVLLRIDSTEALAPDDEIDPLRQMSTRVLQAVCRSWGVDAGHGSTVLWAEVPGPHSRAARRHPSGWCTRHGRFDRPTRG